MTDETVPPLTDETEDHEAEPIIEIPEPQWAKDLGERLSKLAPTQVPTPEPPKTEQVQPPAPVVAPKKPHFITKLPRFF